MRRNSAWLPALALLMPLSAPAATLTLLDTTGDTHSTDIDLAVNPTGSFTVNVRIDLEQNEVVNGLTFVLTSLDNSTFFSLTGRTITGLPMSPGGSLSDPTTANGELLANPQNLLNASNTRDIGLTGPVGAQLNANGTFMTLTISYNNQTVSGNYRFNIGSCSVTSDNGFVDHDIVLGQDYMLRVVPEPTGAALLMIALLPICRRAKRPRRLTPSDAD